MSLQVGMDSQAAAHRARSWLIIGISGAAGLCLSATGYADSLLWCLVWPVSWLMFYGGVALSAVNLLASDRRRALKAWIPLASVLTLGVVAPKTIRAVPTKKVESYFSTHKDEYREAAAWLKTKRIASNRAVEVFLPRQFVHLSVGGSVLVAGEHGRKVIYFPQEFSLQDDGRLGIAYIPVEGPISKHLWENGPLVESPLGGNWYQTWN